MRTFIVIVLLLLVGIGVAGFARGWFGISTSADEERAGITGTVDLERAKKDRDAILALFQTSRDTYQSNVLERSVRFACHAA